MKVSIRHEKNCPEKKSLENSWSASPISMPHGKLLRHAKSVRRLRGVLQWKTNFPLSTSRGMVKRLGACPASIRDLRTSHSLNVASRTLGNSVNVLRDCFWQRCLRVRCSERAAHANWPGMVPSRRSIPTLLSGITANLRAAAASTSVPNVRTGTCSETVVQEAKRRSRSAPGWTELLAECGGFPGTYCFSRAVISSGYWRLGGLGSNQRQTADISC